MTKGSSNLRISTDLSHGHEQGWDVKETGAFIDEKLLGAPPLPRILGIKSTGVSIRAMVKTSRPLSSATLSYTTDSMLPFSKRKWLTVGAKLDGDKLHTPPIADGTTIWILNVIDNEGFCVSSPYNFTKNEK